MIALRVLSTRFSEIEVPDDRILQFPDGLIGFEDYRRFALVSRGESLFLWLQSVDDPDLAFVVTDPLVFVDDYRPRLDEDVRRSLHAAEESDVGYLVIAVVPEDPRDTTINLQAPIAVNRSARLARQLVTMDPSYPLKYYVFRQQQPAGGGTRRDPDREG